DADTIVIGAGAAGLAAARSRAGGSVRVLVLEARARVGGRVWSRPGARNATPAELGAEFIHGRGELTVQLLREAGAAAIDTEGEGWTCSKDGELRREDWDLSSTAGIFEAAGALPDDESVDRFLRRFERDRATRETARAARAFVEGFDAADPAIARSPSTRTCRMRRSKRFRASRWATWSRSRYGSGRRSGSEFETGAIVMARSFAVSDNRLCRFGCSYPCAVYFG